MKKLFFLSVCILLTMSMNAQGVFKVNSTNNAVQLGYDDYRFLTFGDGFTSPNNGAWSIERWNGGLNFWKPWPSSNFGNYKMFIKDNGNVGINMNPFSWGILRLQVSGYTVSNGNFIWSDETLKTNVKNINSGLDQIMQLKPVSYDYIQSVTLGDSSPGSDDDPTKERTMAGDSSGNEADSLRHFGLLAGDVSKVFPNIVSPALGSDKLNAVNYTELIPILIKAVQEQQEMLVSQKQQISELKALVKRN